MVVFAWMDTTIRDGRFYQPLDTTMLTTKLATFNIVILGTTLPAPGARLLRSAFTTYISGRVDEDDFRNFAEEFKNVWAVSHSEATIEIAMVREVIGDYG